MDKLLSDSKFNVLSTHSKHIFNYQLCIRQICGEHICRKKGWIHFGYSELEMPTVYFSGDAQQADGTEALERVLT